MTDFYSRQLPKWPQLALIGNPVTVEQAKEIIFRTDHFLTTPTKYSGGNDREFVKWYMELCGLELDPEPPFDQFRLFNYIQENLGILNLEYLENDWASSSFVYGPSGFCHPDGTIGFGYNIGKWPDVVDVHNELQMLAGDFPFLQMKATLYDGEHCVWEDRELSPVVTFLVVNGEVEMRDNIPVTRAEANQSIKSIHEVVSGIASGRRIEQGLPYDWYVEFAGRVYEQVKKFHLEQ